MEKLKKIFLLGGVLMSFCFTGMVQADDSSNCDEKLSVYRELQEAKTKKSSLEGEIGSAKQKITVLENKNKNIDFAIAAQEYMNSDECKSGDGSDIEAELKKRQECAIKFTELVNKITDSELQADLMVKSLTILEENKKNNVDEIKTLNGNISTLQSELNNYNEVEYEELKQRAITLKVLCKPGTLCQELAEPIGCDYIIMSDEGGTALLQKYASLIYKWIAGIIGFIAVLVIVVSGIQISVSGVIEQQAEAKARIVKVFAGLALLFLTSLILYTINPTFFS